MTKILSRITFIKTKIKYILREETENFYTEMSTIEDSNIFFQSKAKIYLSTFIVLLGGTNLFSASLND